MRVEPKNCALNVDGYCIVTDRECVKACKYATKRFPKVSLRDHLECYWRKRERTVDLLTRWVAVGISIAALTTAIVTYVATHVTGP